MLVSDTLHHFCTFVDFLNNKLRLLLLTNLELNLFYVVLSPHPIFHCVSSDVENGNCCSEWDNGAK